MIVGNISNILSIYTSTQNGDRLLSAFLIFTDNRLFSISLLLNIVRILLYYDAYRVSKEYKVFYHKVWATLFYYSKNIFEKFFKKVLTTEMFYDIIISTKERGDQK